MKRFITTTSSLVASSMLYALDCGNLGISINNASEHQCVLQHTSVYAGYFINQAPLVIPSHSTTSTFYLTQNSSGVMVELDYRCDNNVVIVYSLQERCSIMAGYVRGYAYAGNDLATEHQETIGSNWSDIPGQITWTIH